MIIVWRSILLMWWTSRWWTCQVYLWTPWKTSHITSTHSGAQPSLFIGYRTAAHHYMIGNRHHKSPRWRPAPGHRNSNPRNGQPVVSCFLHIIFIAATLRKPQCLSISSLWLLIISPPPHTPPKKKQIMEFIKNPNSIIVAVSPANADLANSEVNYRIMNPPHMDISHTCTHTDSYTDAYGMWVYNAQASQRSSISLIL